METEYTVTLRFQYPAYDERDGIEYVIKATSKRDAIAYARRQAERDGHAGTGVNKGRQWFKAVENQ